MSLKGPDELAVHDIPEPDFAEPGGFTGRRRELFTVCRERHGVHRAAMSGERPHHRAGLGGNQIHFAIPRGGDELGSGCKGECLDRAPWRDGGSDLRQDKLARGFGRLLGRERSSIDPAFDRRDLFRRKLLPLARRHDAFLAVLLQLSLDQFHHQTVSALAGLQRRAGFAALHQRLETFHHQLALRFLRRMTIQAVLRENGIHGCVVIRRPGGARRDDGKNEKRGCDGAEECSEWAHGENLATRFNEAEREIALSFRLTAPARASP